jgi:hypothetical protein
VEQGPVRVQQDGPNLPAAAAAGTTGSPLGHAGVGRTRTPLPAKCRLVSSIPH